MRPPWLEPAGNRCRTHYLKNLLTKSPKVPKRWRPPENHLRSTRPGLRMGPASPCRRPSWTGRTGRHRHHIDRVAAEILTLTGFPKPHWRQIWSDSPQERLNKEFRRCTNVVDIFQPEVGHSSRRVASCRTTRLRGHRPALHEPREPRPNPHQTHRQPTKRTRRGGDPRSRTSNRLERNLQGRRGITHTLRHWT